MISERMLTTFLRGLCPLAERYEGVAPPKKLFENRPSYCISVKYAQ